MNFDDIDRRILRELQIDAGQSIQDLANKVGLSATPVTRRIKLLRDAGVIKEQVALLDADLLGLKVSVFVTVKTSHHDEEWLETFAAGVQEIPEVMEFYRMSGDIDYLMKIVLTDLADYDTVYRRLIRIAPLSDVSSSFSMEKIKNTTVLPLNHLQSS